MLIASAAGQRSAWRVPPAGAVEYERSGRATASAACASKSRARRAAVPEPLPARYLRRLPPAPLVCAGELRGDRRALQAPVADLRDVLRFVACDLSGGSGTYQFPRLLPFGDVTVRGRWSKADAAGRQSWQGSLVARSVKARSVKTGRREDKDVARRLAALCVRDASGDLQLTRIVDFSTGLVRSFSGECDLLVAEAERRYRRLHIVESWEFVAVRDNQDFDFRKRVAAAIRKGAAWVRSAIESDQSYLQDRRGERNYGSGRLALALLALLHGHVAADDAVVVAGFAALRRRRIDDAYSLATALMAMEAWHRRTALSERDRKVAARWLARLLTCVDPRTDPAEQLRFNYTRGPRYDTSLQQYGLLGMRAAQQIALPLPDGAFAAAARHLLSVQAAGGKSLEVRWTDAAQVRAVAGSADLPGAHARRVRARGFAYQDGDEPAFGSMTSAGVSGLLLARDGLRARSGRSGGGERALLRRIDDAVADGFGWLAENFSVRCNPGYAERADNHWSYWLYCLERCCELGGVARLQGRDWYYEGGLQLLHAQSAGGSFRAAHPGTKRLDATCFAILFLSKASAPVPITGR